MVRTACGDDPERLHTPNRRAGVVTRGPMQKKRNLRAPSQRKVSSAKQPSGLIANGQTRTQSARAKSALDNLSHRTADERAAAMREERTLARAPYEVGDFSPISPPFHRGSASCGCRIAVVVSG